MRLTAGFHIVEPGLTLLPRLATVVEAIQATYRYRQTFQRMQNPLTDSRSLLAGKPFPGVVIVSNFRQQLL